PPAALVSRKRGTPAQRSERTARHASSAPQPSYRCTRPVRHATSSPSTLPSTSAPPCPSTFGTGQCGTSANGISTAPSTRAAKPLSPPPSTSARRASCAPAASRKRAAAWTRVLSSTLAPHREAEVRDLLAELVQHVVERDDLGDPVALEHGDVAHAVRLHAREDRLARVADARRHERCAHDGGDLRALRVAARRDDAPREDAVGAVALRPGPPA